MRNDRVVGDPLHIGPRGKTRSQRKAGRDPGLTPTESRKKDALMRQFLARDGTQGNTDAYRESLVWCWCGRLNGTHGHGARE